jgi:hypothetical protein
VSDNSVVARGPPRHIAAFVFPQRIPFVIELNLRHVRNVIYKILLFLCVLLPQNHTSKHTHTLTLFSLSLLSVVPNTTQGKQTTLPLCDTFGLPQKHSTPHYSYEE